MNTHSRFAVLAPEVDLDVAHKAKSGAKRDKIKKENKQNENEKVKAKTTSQTNNTVIKKKKKEINDLQALAFGYGKPIKGNDKKKVVPNGNHKEKEKTNNKGKKGKSSNNNHDDDWKKRDEEFVKEQNETSLREAILQSKLEFEQKKKEEKLNEKNTVKSESSALTKGSSKSKKKKEKPLTLSLNQFNNLELKDLETLKPSNRNGRATEEKGKENGPEIVVQDEKFFRDVDETTRKTLEMEHRHEKYKELRKNTRNMNYETQVKNLTSEIETRDFEIQALRLEVDSLKNQLQAVKARNKKLCEVISFSEMRSKGELVVELEKVTKGRDEFSEEVARLTAELEQERTRVSHLNNELKKLQGKKRTADSSSK